jgi:hypothetical protein
VKVGLLGALLSQPRPLGIQAELFSYFPKGTQNKTTKEAFVLVGDPDRNFIEAVSLQFFTGKIELIYLQ